MILELANMQFSQGDFNFSEQIFKDYHSSFNSEEFDDRIFTGYPMIKVVNKK